MSRVVKTLLLLLSIVILLSIITTWYTYEFSMELAKTYQINSPDMDHKLLIATQGSKFKDAITEGIVNHYRSDPIFIKVIDVSSLTELAPEDYNAIVIIHTWENWKPPAVVRRFIERTTDQHSKMVVLTTSGQGSYSIRQIDTLYNLENIDALAGESNLEQVASFIKQVIERLHIILEPENQFLPT